MKKHNIEKIRVFLKKNRTEILAIFRMPEYDGIPVPCENTEQYPGSIESEDDFLFCRENMETDFTEIGAIRGEKDYIQSEIRNPDEHWLKRSGIPRYPGLREAGGGSMKKDQFVFEIWEADEQMSEAEDLRVLFAPEKEVLPKRLREGEVDGLLKKKLQREFLSERLRHIIYRPYRFLLLKYSRQYLSRLDWSPEQFDKLTRGEARMVRIVIFEGVMALATGSSWEDVWDDTVRKIFARWFEEEGMIDVAIECFEDISSMCEEFQKGLPVGLRFLLRITWKTLSDIRILYHLVPLMPEFDILIGCGISLREAYAHILARQLEMKPCGEISHPARFFLKKACCRHISPALQADYRFMDHAVALLECLGFRVFESKEGLRGEKSWRTVYPNGHCSFWHSSMELAKRDLAGHLSNVFSHRDHLKSAMVPFLLKNEETGAMTVDFPDLNVYRLSESKSGGVLFDRLARKAVEDLLHVFFGLRSFRFPGEDILVHDQGTVESERVIGWDAIRGRSDVAERYVGPIRKLGVDAANCHISNLKGLLIHRVEIFNAGNPLAVIEDKAEVVWDRLIRSGQLSERDAWHALHLLKRVDHGGEPSSFMHRGQYLRLIEELSQLSKEYYIMNLDHDHVPESVAIWFRYALCRPLPLPEEMEEIRKKAAGISRKLSGEELRALDEWADVFSSAELRSLAKAAATLKESLSSVDLPRGFEDMLKDSAGMHVGVRAERFWAFHSAREPYCLSLLERAIHGMLHGYLERLLPEHAYFGLCGSLASEFGWSLNEAREKAGKALESTSRLLSEFPELSLWGRNGEGKYVKLVERRRIKKGAYGGTVRGGCKGRVPEWMGECTLVCVEAPRKVFDDYYCRRYERLPACWGDVERICETIRVLDTSRKFLLSCPQPFENGVCWKGQRYCCRNGSRPCGVPASWNESVPFAGCSQLIGRVREMNPMHKGVHTPMLIEAREESEILGNCLIYHDPEDSLHTVRVMPGIPEAPGREARGPYVVHCCRGVFLDVDGAPVPVDDVRASFIPLEMFRGVDIKGGKEKLPAEEYKSMMRKRLLNELSDPDFQKDCWWSPDTGDSTLAECVIRLYEETGFSASYTKGKTGLESPAFVEMLRFVAHVLNSPGAMSSSLESGMPYHGVILQEGKTLKRFSLDE